MCTGSGASVFVTPRSAAALTFVVAVALLLPAFGSGPSAMTDAVFVIVPAVLGLILIVTVAVPALTIVPSPHETVVVPLQVPCVAVADTNVELAGRVSMTVAPVA